MINNDGGQGWCCGGGHVEGGGPGRPSPRSSQDSVVTEGHQTGIGGGRGPDVILDRATAAQ